MAPAPLDPQFHACISPLFPDRVNPVSLQRVEQHLLYARISSGASKAGVLCLLHRTAGAVTSGFGILTRQQSRQKLSRGATGIH